MGYKIPTRPHSKFNWIRGNKPNAVGDLLAGRNLKPDYKETWL